VNTYLIHGVDDLDDRGYNACFIPPIAEKPAPDIPAKSPRRIFRRGLFHSFIFVDVWASNKVVK